ncbi:hypothetical protein SO802_003228 [Lithocarpus litseifolius]|uniref:Reverse transcriptase zinc-binding domain-containing protein n=1 Tax=Lithocarpus litseifolius TaxID=425828 RepID=A0AAW2E195_9ROSI
MVNLKKRGIGENDFCPCCGREVESIFHSIIKCEVAKRVWDFWGVQFVENGQELYDISEVALQILDKRSVYDLEVFFGVAWSIWYNRNLIVFESTCRLPSQIWGFANRYLHDYRGARVALNKSQGAENCRFAVVERNLVEFWSKYCRISSDLVGSNEISPIFPYIYKDRAKILMDLAEICLYRRA